MKKIISLLLSLLLLIPLMTFAVSAGSDSALDNFRQFWRVSAMKWQSTGEYKHIQNFIEARYKDNGYEPYYEMTDDGGVKLTALTYDQAPGAMSSQCIGSKVRCPLAGLEVKLRFDDFVMNRLINLGSTIYVLWCTEEIGGMVDGYYNDYAQFCQGWEQAYYVGQNGLRDSMPMGSKGLSICISGSGNNGVYLGTQTASTVSISCFDGEYINQNDGHLGKRWTFGYRSGDIINQPMQRIDFSDGLTIKVRADEKLGFVVGVTDSTGIYREYCDTSKVSYFPDLPGTGNNWTVQEPDFSILKDEIGYLYIGASASAKDDMNIFTVESVNGIRMDSPNQLHTHTPDGNVVTEQEFPCKEGISYETCTECGERCNIKTVPATADHDWDEWVEDVAASCVAGEKHRVCKVCGDEEKSTIDPVAEHTPGDWALKTDATASADGLLVRKCEVCGNEVETKAFPFKDVLSANWFAKYVVFNYIRGFVTGMTETTFDPNSSLTRAQFVTILSAVEGIDKSAYGTGIGNKFTDVPDSQWFAPYVDWAYQNGIVNGLTDTTFGPNDKVTREQIALMMMKYAEKKGADVTFEETAIDSFSDKDAVSPWAKDAMCWAVSNGLISGIDNGDGTMSLAPKANATRAQVATINMALVLNLLEA
ncbi:MAG: S-layer homology domain-containing protein [Clostridia bacterium]|nr:S-layer homology domain-containing protein [Clostridia bacterium]